MYEWIGKHGITTVFVAYLAMTFVTISMPFWAWKKPTEFTSNGKVCIKIDHNVYCKEELICKPAEYYEERTFRLP